MGVPVVSRGKGGMGVLKIRCPNTGELVATGVVMDEEAFKLIRLTAQVFLCDACSEIHVWEKDDAIHTTDDGP